MSSNVTHGNGFEPLPGSTPVRKMMVREAVAMIARGETMNAAIYAVYDRYCAEPFEQTDGETSMKNAKAIEKAIRRLMNRASNARISVPTRP